MKTLIIIGNGFDLGHKLPTRFEDFIKSEINVLSEKYSKFRGTNDNWSEVEDTYKQLLDEIVQGRESIDVIEEVEDIINGYGFNKYGEVDYYNYTSEALHEENKKITSFIELLNEFEQDFLEYLKENCSDEALKTKVACSAITDILTNSSTIINFNYTNIVEIVYEIKEVIHIHGNINDDIAIGCGAVDEMKKSLIDDKYPILRKFEMDKHVFLETMNYYEEDMEGNLVEKHSIKTFFDEVSSAIKEEEMNMFALLDEKSKGSLALRRKVIDDFKKEHYDEVYIMGHSLGEADFEVLNAINKDVKVICFYHSDEDSRTMKRGMKKMGWNFKLLPNEDLYKSK